MSLDMNCVRDVLMTMQEEEVDERWVFYKDSRLLSDYSAKDVIHHVKLCSMVDIVGDVKVYFRKYMDVGGLTDSGKRFVELISDDKIWSILRAKDSPPEEVEQDDEELEEEEA